MSKPKMNEVVEWIRKDFTNFTQTSGMHPEQALTRILEEYENIGNIGPEYELMVFTTAFSIKKEHGLKAPGIEEHFVELLNATQ